MDLTFLHDLATTPGPFATVYLDASHDSADAQRAVGLRWASTATSWLAPMPTTRRSPRWRPRSSTAP